MWWNDATPTNARLCVQDSYVSVCTSYRCSTLTGYGSTSRPAYGTKHFREEDSAEFLGAQVSWHMCHPLHYCSVPHTFLKYMIGYTD